MLLSPYQSQTSTRLLHQYERPQAWVGDHATAFVSEATTYPIHGMNGRGSAGYPAGGEVTAPGTATGRMPSVAQLSGAGLFAHHVIRNFRRGGRNRRHLSTQAARIERSAEIG